MATITATSVDAPRTGDRARRRVATAWSRAVHQATATVSTARQRLRLSPVLTVAGFAALDAAAWTTFGRGAAWAALGTSILAFDWTRDGSGTP